MYQICLYQTNLLFRFIISSSPVFPQICNYAPDLAKTIARLILSSNDLNFQGKCCSLLGVQPPDMNMEAVEYSIRERIVSVIGKNDQKPQRSREAAEILFEDQCFMEDEYQELEEVYLE